MAVNWKFQFSPVQYPKEQSKKRSSWKIGERRKVRLCISITRTFSGMPYSSSVALQPVQCPAREGFDLEHQHKNSDDRHGRFFFFLESVSGLEKKQHRLDVAAIVGTSFICCVQITLLVPCVQCFAEVAYKGRRFPLKGGLYIYIYYFLQKRLAIPFVSH